MVKMVCRFAPRSRSSSRWRRSHPRPPSRARSPRPNRSRRRSVGNTISGVEDGASYVEYIVPDGTIRGIEADELYTGRWQIAGPKFCMSYVDDGGAWKPVGVLSDRSRWSAPQLARRGGSAPRRRSVAATRTACRRLATPD